MKVSNFLGSPMRAALIHSDRRTGVKELVGVISPLCESV